MHFPYPLAMGTVGDAALSHGGPPFSRKGTQKFLSIDSRGDRDDRRGATAAVELEADPGRYHGRHL